MSQPSTAEVTCPAGTVLGTVSGDVRRFHSIAYSRISAPFNDALPAPGGMLIDATTPRPDATALSLTTPATARAGDDLPVMVFIHGGRFEEGTHADPRTGADDFARQGVIQVRVGYRLRLAGLARFPDDAPSHYRAAHDCQLALEWVQRNIEAFGGDPTNVTMVGQSAGATLALWLARRDHYRGGFRRVLAMSPAFPRVPYEKRKAALRAFLGKPLTRSALNNAAPTRVERAYRRLRTLHFSDMALGPAPLEPEELAEVDIVVTSTREEMYRLGERADRVGLGRASARAFAARMEVNRFPEYMEAAAARDAAHPSGQMFGDSLIRRWVDAVAERAPGRVWEAELVSERGPLHHSDDLDALFGTGNHRPGRGLNGWLVRFCRTGETGWPAYAPGRAVLRADVDGTACGVVTDPLAHVRRAFAPGSQGYS